MNGKTYVGIFVIFKLLIVAGLLIASYWPPFEGTQVYIKKVIDGDTYELFDGRRIRLIGVNTPETKHPHKQVEYYGPESYRYAKKLLEGTRVSLEYGKERHDRYGRTLAYVYLQNNVMVNALLLHGGYARVMTIPPNTAHAEIFEHIEKEAREKHLGLWR